MTNGNEAVTFVDNAPLSGYGLTKREYFAAMALQGILASGVVWHKTSFTERAVIHADELIAQLNRGNKQ